jgi:phosphatidate cytidylyltransferase
MFANAFNHPLFLPAITRLASLFAVSLVIILWFNRKDVWQTFHKELGARFIGWLFIGPLIFLALFTGGTFSRGLLSLIILLAGFEFSRITKVESRYMWIVRGWTVITVGLALRSSTLFFATPALVFFSLTLVPILTNSISKFYDQVVNSLILFIYVVWTLCHLLLIGNMPFALEILTITLTGVAFSDMFAYIVGKAIGKTKIAPAVSPNKAYEGWIGNILGVIIAMVSFQFLLPPLAWWQLVIWVAIIGLGSSWGDLLSSLIKRNNRVKDWGKLIPGHGGILDRANSTIVVIPLVYYVFRYWFGF